VTCGVFACRWWACLSGIQQDGIEAVSGQAGVTSVNGGHQVIIRLRAKERKIPHEQYASSVSVSVSVNVSDRSIVRGS
jgi:hypothetical protein